MLVATGKQVGNGFDPGMWVRPDAILARLHAERAEVIQKYPRAHRLEVAIRERTLDGKRAYRRDVRLDNAVDALECGGFHLTPFQPPN
jgi:hypothetical protein